MELLKKILFFDIFPFLCRFIFCLLFLLALFSLGYPPKTPISSSSVTLFLFALFFLLLPIANKISIGKVLTFERKVNEIRNDVSDFKAETRDFLNVYSNIITAISNTVSQTINVNLPGQAEAQEAKEQLDSTIKGETEPATIENDVEIYLSQSGNDLNLALARLRMDIERNLRELLGKRTVTQYPSSMQGKFMSARQLFKEFTTQYPDYKGMYSSFDYILKVCNAAIHGQKIYDGQGQEALYMGIKMLKEFETLNIKEF